MPFLLIYIIKFSISLAVVFLFYQLVLRRLTFYNWNRVYLLGYTLFSFVVPFIDISGSLYQNQLAESEMISWLPIFQLKESAAYNESSFTVWNIISLLLVGGIIFMTIRLLVQLVSFQRMMKKATLVSNQGLNLYQVDEKIIPFSFGNSVFINSRLHSETELQEIIQHEIVHVKQKHSIDIIWSEILCLFNWFNPFAWLIRKAIRQNLEFIADNKVLDNGVDRKQYQYLLLKVIGSNRFSIAQKFNFSSLKKRIAMMNKLKSTKINLLRFLFVLPLIAVILVSFRNKIGDTMKKNSNDDINVPQAMTDTIPLAKVFTDKNYFIYVMKNEESPLIIIKDKNKKEVTRLTMKEWSEKEEYYEGLYGKLPPPPPPLPPPPPPPPMKLPENVEKINASNGNVTVWLKNGSKEKYDLTDVEQRMEFDKKYGKLPEPPPPPVLPNGVKDMSRNGQNIVTVTMENGKTEKFDLNKNSEKSQFEKNYGKMPEPPPPPPSNDLDEMVSKMNSNFEIVDASKNGFYNPENASRSGTITNVRGKTPLIVIDGEIVSEEVMAKLDKETIQSIDVLKDKSATTLYGDKGKDGVLIIKTKAKGTKESNPLIVLDGKIVTKTEMDNLSPHSIESINVLKGKNATDLYLEKGKDGVIVITSKKN